MENIARKANPRLQNVGEKCPVNTASSGVSRKKKNIHSWDTFKDGTKCVELINATEAL